MSTKKQRDDVFRNGENGVKRTSTRYDILDAQQDGHFPVRDGGGRPLVRNGPRAGKVDWNKVEEENKKGTA